MPTLTPRLLRLASDARLVGLVREGRDAAFEAIYDRHHRPILSFCRHMLGDADEAEDAVQHTFMAAYTDLLTSDKPIHLRAWLFTIARNRCYTILRSRREHPTAELEEAATEGLAAEVQRRQDLRDLVNDMRRLPEEQRAALVLAELDALSHTDIAEVLGVPREKVKALVFQARESLLASRNARDTACSEIREQLECGRGATLRRANLRRHLRECDGCRAYRAQVDRQRKQFAVLLPVVPGVALKQAVFSGGGGAAGASAAVGGGALVSTALKGGAIKGIVAVIAASVSTAGTVVVATGNLPVSSLLHTVTHTFGGGSSAPRTHHAIASARAHTAPAAVSVSAAAPAAPRHVTTIAPARPAGHAKASVRTVAVGRRVRSTIVRVPLRRPAVVLHPTVRTVTSAPRTVSSPPVTHVATPAPTIATASAPAPTTSPAPATSTPKVTVVSTPSGGGSGSSGSTSGTTPTGTVHVVSVSPSSPTSVTVARTGSGTPSGTHKSGSGGPTSSGTGSTTATVTTSTGTTRGTTTTATPTTSTATTPASTTSTATTPTSTTSTSTTTTGTGTGTTTTTSTVSDIGTATTGTSTTSTTPVTPGRALAPGS
jgi:RNA polymerase sigma factor (sigma-70 family)